VKSLASIVLSCASAMAFASDSTTLVIPKITKPLVEPAENDPLQADYDKMWAEYESAIQTATVAIKEALAKQLAKATDSGELDLVEMWEGKQKQFAEKRLLDWDTGSKASVEWKKTNPKVPYPREFNEAVRSAASSFASAKEKLEEGYADLVKAYTKAKNVPRAKELRDEGAAVLAGNTKSSPQTEAGPEPKPRNVEQPAIVGLWVDETNGWALECLPDKTARNLNPKGQVDTLGTWKDEGNGRYTAFLGSWHWQIVVRGKELECVRYNDGTLKGSAAMKRRR
jgi:hypothetical protein